MACWAFGNPTGAKNPCRACGTNSVSKNLTATRLALLRGGQPAVPHTTVVAERSETGGLHFQPRPANRDQLPALFNLDHQDRVAKAEHKVLAPTLLRSVWIWQGKRMLPTTGLQLAHTTKRVDQEPRARSLGARRAGHRHSESVGICESGA